jgi:UDP-N-acetylglucosamine acyltransferase
VILADSHYFCFLDLLIGLASMNSMPRLHSTAIIGEDVTLLAGIEVGPYSIIENGVTIGANTVIGSHVIIKSGTIVGTNCLIDSFALLGGLPQYTGFDRTIVSGVKIGDNTSIREHVTVHRPTQPLKFTTIGSGCMLQSGVHVAHDCVVGNNTILANGSMLGGEVTIGDNCFIGGGAAVHQMVRIGDCAILGGNSATSLDLPPYTMASGISTLIGINYKKLYDLKLPRENILALKTCVREFYKRSGLFQERANQMLLEGYGFTYETDNFLRFFLVESHRGCAPKRHRITKSHN